MKNILILLSLALCIAICSCNRSVNKHQSFTDVKKEQLTVKNDSNHLVTEQVNETTQHYGDTLKASLSFDNTSMTDSVESSGISIKGTLIKTEGGYKLKINAIAKPVDVVNRNTLKTDDKQLIHESIVIDNDSTGVTEDVKKKVRESEPHLNCGPCSSFSC